MIKDAIGQSHEVALEPKIICLVPSITELLFNMGLGDKIVGRTVFCIHPKDRVKSVKSIGGTKQVNMDKIKDLNATHLIVNIDENPKELVDELAKIIPHIVVTHPNTPEDNITLYQLMGDIFDKKGEAARLMSELQASIAQAQMGSDDLEDKTVLYFIWKDPWMTVSKDTYIAQSLKSAKLNVCEMDSDRRYPDVDLESGVLSNVDAVLFSSEPFLFKESHLDEFATTFKIDRAKLHIIDGEMTSWYGSRAIEGLRYLNNFARTI